MKNIVLVRIDDRLIHGQIMTQWSRLYSPTEIMVVDDETAGFVYDRGAADGGAQGVQSRGGRCGQGGGIPAAGGGEERILMLVKVPETVEALVDRGVEIRALNVGGMCKRAGRSTLYRNISSSPAENETLLRLQKRGVRVYVTVNTLVKDAELAEALDFCAYLCSLPVDGILVQDMGLFALLHEACPEMPLHASTQMSLHTLSGIQEAASSA